MNEKEAKELAEEAIENGVIGYNEFDFAVLLYKGYVIWPEIIDGDPCVFILWKAAVKSKHLHDKLQSMFDAWEAI